MADLILRENLDGTDFSDVSDGMAIPPVTPGEVLCLEFMEPAGLSARALAKAICVPANRITAILHGTRGITADTALLLGKYFRTSAEFWMHLQTAHDLETARTDAVGSGADEVLKAMKEDLVVGKREAEAGGIRVTSHVVETPVQEQVTLHEERVTIERHLVNERVVGVGDAFADKTIETRVTSDEAVVGKEARVIEEIGIKKKAADRVETVRDTVRKTEVDVEDTSVPSWASNAIASRHDGKS